jgi:hypothetical protein
LSTSEKEKRPAPSPKLVDRIRYLVGRIRGVSVCCGIFAVVLLTAYSGISWVWKSWTFAIEVDTEIVELELLPSPQNRWLVGGTTICVPPKNEPPKKLQALPAPVTEGGAPCGKDWFAGRIPNSEYILALEASSAATARNTAPMKIRLEKLNKHAIHAAFSPPTGNEIRAVIEPLDGSEPMQFVSPFVVIWDGAIRSDKQTSDEILPFQGVAHVGREVSIGVDRVLVSGKVSIFSPPFLSFTQRYLLEERPVMQGDRLSLVKTDNTLPGGFITGGRGRIPDVMRVVAFGTSDQLDVYRFGATRYDFHPSIFQLLANDPLAICLLGLISFCVAIVNLVPASAAGGAMENGTKGK